MLTTFYSHVTEAMKQEGLSLKEVAGKLNEHGIKGVEIDYGELKLKDGSFNVKLVNELKEAGIPVFGCYVFYDWSRRPFDISYKKVYKNLASVGIKNSLAIPGFYHEGLDNEKALSRMVKKMKKAVAYANKLGVTVLIEDFDNVDSPIATAEGMKHFFDRVDNLKCAFDTGNFYYSAQDALEKLPMFIDNVAYVHCKDRFLEVKEGETPLANVKGIDMYSCAVGQGVIPIKEIIEKLLANGYDGSFAIEHFGSQHQLQDMIDSADYINKIKGTN